MSTKLMPKTNLPVGAERTRLDKNSATRSWTKLVDCKLVRMWPQSAQSTRVDLLCSPPLPIACHRLRELYRTNTDSGGMPPVPFVDCRQKRRRPLAENTYGCLTESWKNPEERQYCLLSLSPQNDLASIKPWLNLPWADRNNSRTRDVSSARSCRRGFGPETGEEHGVGVALVHRANPPGDCSQHGPQKQRRQRRVSLYHAIESLFGYPQ